LHFVHITKLLRRGEDGAQVGTGEAALTPNAHGGYHSLPDIRTEDGMRALRPTGHEEGYNITFREAHGRLAGYPGLFM